jgi:hypothetical protein
MFATVEFLDFEKVKVWRRQSLYDMRLHYWNTNAEACESKDLSSLHRGLEKRLLWSGFE